MAIPDYQKCMSPLLEYAADGKEHSIGDAYDAVATLFNLTEDEKRELIPSGTQQIYKNRIGWARTYLSKAGLLQNTRRGHFRITPRGQETLKQDSQEINTTYLMQFEEFEEFRKRPSKTDSVAIGDEPDSHTPEELLEKAVTDLNSGLASEIQESLLRASPAFFERVVIDLLVKMGYGGSRQEAAQVVGRSGDEGIDGIINEDRLGLDAIYVQAKRWDNVVSRPEIQKFAGALLGKSANKGVFITTSRFSNEAKEFAEMIDSKVVLIDGERLASLMIEYDLGVSTERTYQVKKIDGDYFSEE